MGCGASGPVHVEAPKKKASKSPGKGKKRGGKGKKRGGRSKDKKPREKNPRNNGRGSSSSSSSSGSSSGKSRSSSDDKADFSIFQRKRAQRGLKKLKSEKGKDKMRIRFKNNAGEPLSIYWIDYEGKQHHYKTLPARQHWRVSTFVTHPWAIYTDGQKQIEVVLVVNDEIPDKANMFRVRLAKRGGRVIVAKKGIAPGGRMTGRPKNDSSSDSD